jgi:hypothetical protein
VADTVNPPGPETRKTPLAEQAGFTGWEESRKKTTNMALQEALERARAAEAGDRPKLRAEIQEQIEFYEALYKELGEAAENRDRICLDLGWRGDFSLPPHVIIPAIDVHLDFLYEEIQGLDAKQG